MEIQEWQELQELRQNIVKYSHFAAKIQKKHQGLGLGFRVLIRFTCDSYVFAYVVHWFLRYSAVIPVVPVIPVFPYTGSHEVCMW